MKILKAYKFRLCPNKEQVSVLKQHGGNSRFIWNKLLEKANDVKKQTGKFVFSQSLFQKQIKQLKAENEFTKLGYSQPIQYNALKLNETFIKAFDPENVALRKQKIAKANAIEDPEKKAKALAKALAYAFPKFKKKSDCYDSLFYPQHFIVKRSRILFPKIGWIHYIRHRDIEGKILSLNITQDGSEQYYVSITCESEIADRIKKPLDQANIAGIDVGLEVFATLDNGEEIQNPRTLKKNLKKLRRANRKLSRQQLVETDKKTFNNKVIKESSKRRDKQLLTLQRIHRKIRNIRKDFIYKTVYHIINTYDGVIMEKLDIQDMLQKGSRALNRSITDASWSEFARILGYKSAWLGKYFLQLDQYFPSTQLCNNCGNISHLSLKDRVYICPCCGMRAGRDINAARNIKEEGLRILREIYSTLSTNKSGSTVAATGIYARGLTALAVRKKREKRRFQQSVMTVA